MARNGFLSFFPLSRRYTWKKDRPAARRQPESEPEEMTAMKLNPQELPMADASTAEWERWLTALNEEWGHRLIGLLRKMAPVSRTPRRSCRRSC